MKFIFIFLWSPFLLVSFTEYHRKPPSTDIPRNYLDNILHPEFLYPSLPIRGTLAFPHGPIPCFFKKYFFNVEFFKFLLTFFFFFTILLLFYVLVFWQRSMCDHSSATRDRTCAPSSGNTVLTTGLPPKSQQTYFNCFHYPPTYISFKNKII